MAQKFFGVHQKRLQKLIIVRLFKKINNENQNTAGKAK
jgi:hypothetical protein